MHFFCFVFVMTIDLEHIREPVRDVFASSFSWESRVSFLLSFIPATVLLLPSLSAFVPQHVGRHILDDSATLSLGFCLCSSGYCRIFLSAIEVSLR